ncbi:MAG: hypothetical protein M1828_001737 [Chrysothrix sp. TS-e1954]|nr:MAG: hypothetical protein M1828_001737 [Chrysothrix sp. TS-e1954]
MRKLALSSRLRSWLVVGVVAFIVATSLVLHSGRHLILSPGAHLQDIPWRHTSGDSNASPSGDSDKPSEGDPPIVAAPPNPPTAPGTPELPSAPNAATDSFLHLLVPATSSNKHLCRLIASLTALDYPTPVFIHWGRPEAENPYVQHLAKVEGILDYLNDIEKTNGDDLVLILDGYDILVQLPPSLIIQRYYDVIGRANARVRDRLGQKKMEEHGIYQSVVFGADKICWPEDATSPNCWAVPDSTMPSYTFGPQTDTGEWRHHNRPRWLNSGTIIGKVREVRDLFEGTLNRIQSRYIFDSDQYYFAQIWGEQEYARTLLAEGSLRDKTRTLWISDGYQGEGHEETLELVEPALSPGQKTEYHITLDYESKLFQTTAYYHQYLGWRQYDAGESEQPNNGSTSGSDLWPCISQDIIDSPKPLLGRRDVGSDLGDALREDPTWRSVPLGTNAATGEVFGILHFTPPKTLRDLWWPRMWYLPYMKALVKGISSSQIERDGECGQELITETEDGRRWHKFDYGSRAARESGKTCVGGGMADTGKWISWELLCDAFESSVHLDYE